MPVDNGAYQKYYGALQQAYGQNGALEKGAFTIGMDDFKRKMADSSYAQKIYGALSNAYGDSGKLEKGAFTLPFNDFYSKVSAPTKAQAQPAAKSIIDQSLFHIPKQATEATPSLVIPKPTGQTLEEAHADQIQKASNNLVQTFNANKDKAINKIISTDFKQQQDHLNSSYQNGMIDEKAYNERRKQLFNKIVNPATEIGNFKQDLATNQGKVRQIVHEIAKSDPEKAGQLKADMYLLDSKTVHRKQLKYCKTQTTLSPVI